MVIDGAHAPGLLPVDLDGIGADFWVGNLHKWLCAPKASAVLYAAPQWRDGLRPLVASHRFDDGFQAAFDWTGTQDPSPLLAATAALAFFEQVGWPAVWEHNNDLARARSRTRRRPHRDCRAGRGRADGGDEADPVA